MVETYYKQCALGKGILRLVTWLPEKFAKQGKILNLREQGAWHDGWKVLDVYSTRLSITELLDRSRDHLRTREASDV